MPLHEWKEHAATGEKLSDIAVGENGLTTWLIDADSFAPCGKIKGEKTYSIVTDHLGTPSQMYKEDGSLFWEGELDSYGKVRMEKGEVGSCPFRYQGQYEDVETGLYYNRFRYYAVEGFYVSQDPVDIVGGLNFYSYVNDVNTYFDRFGLLGEGETAPYGHPGHTGDGRDAHEILRNKFLQDNGVASGGVRHPDNPSMALTRANHTLVHNEEAALRAQRGLARNQMMRRGKDEIRLMHQAINNTLVRNGTISIQQLRIARRLAEKFAKRVGRY